MVQFDNYKGSCINGNLFPVATITRFCEKNGRKFTRKQFPLKVAYAITIHKSQGLTLELIVIDIGDVEFAAGLTYVVLTRVKNITDLVFIIYKDKKRFDKIGGSRAAKLKIEFLKRLHLKATGNTHSYKYTMNMNEQMIHTIIITYIILIISCIMTIIEERSLSNTILHKILLISY